MSKADVNTGKRVQNRQRRTDSARQYRAESAAKKIRWPASPLFLRHRLSVAALCNMLIVFSSFFQILPSGIPLFRGSPFLVLMRNV